MIWYVALARFGAGLFLANGVPHFVQGIAGKRFQSPFVSPQGVGKSSPVVNVIWGMTNLVVGYVLICAVGDFVGGMSKDALIVGLGVLIASVGLASYFGRVHGR
jgi:hypothetical protein